jgi:DnaJ-class molecular chaperone
MACLYDVLGVAKDASAEEVKAAFCAAAFKLHPDQAAGGGSNGADADGAADARAFQRVLSAYEVLRDPARRALYDTLRLSGADAAAAGAQGAWWAPGGPGAAAAARDFDSAFEEWLKRMGGDFDFDFDAAEGARVRRERAAAALRRRAEAWAAEKADAAGVRARGRQLRARATPPCSARSGRRVASTASTRSSARPSL